jgi:HD domain
MRREDRGVVDLSALRMREATIAAGVWLTYVLCGAAGVYVALTWSRSTRPDGSGYPDGLSGEAIPQAARILLVAGAFDAITSGRPYRTPLPRAEACEELRRYAGTQFDPACVQALCRYLETSSVLQESIVATRA